MPGKPFQVGNKFGKGRPRGAYSGRTRALLLLDEVLAEADTQEKLRDAFRAEIDKDPARFFRTFVMPLLPREEPVDQAPVRVVWSSLLDTFKLPKQTGAATKLPAHDNRAENHPDP